MNLDTLFKSQLINQLILKNKLAMAPMTRHSAPDGIIQADSIPYYKERAEGGIGLLFTEACYVNPQANGYKNIPNLYMPKAVEAWQQIVNAVQIHDAAIFAQLYHVGSIRASNNGPVPGLPAVAPSSLPHPGLKDLTTFKQVDDNNTVHELSLTEIDVIIESFVENALNAQKIGFNGVEIHAAHGYLLDQFQWSFTNKRTDKYGGRTIAERATFTKEIIQAVRHAVGKDYPISTRISLWKLGAYDAMEPKTPKELEAWVQILADAGVDVMNTSTHDFEPAIYPKENQLSFAGWVKKLSGVPTIATGGIGLTRTFPETVIENKRDVKFNLSSIENVANRIEKGEFDMASFGRCTLSDPAIANKLQQHQYQDIIAYTPEFNPFKRENT